MNSEYFKYWGKASKSDNKYHLLAYHSLDVAATGITLLKGLKVLKTLCQITSLDKDKSINIYAFFLALHDIGKFSNGFQNLRPDLVIQLKGKNKNVSYNEKHWTLGYRFIKKNASKVSVFNKSDFDTMSSWISAVTGHHGRPPQNVLGAAPVSFQFNDVATRSALNFIFDVENLFQIKDCMSYIQTLDEEQVKRASWYLAGITVLADWIGSNAKWFPYLSDEIPLQKYFSEIAMPNAEKAIKESGILPLVPAKQKSFSELFPAIKQATPLQKTIEVVEVSKTPELYIIEEITGAGKTEAALILTHKIISAGNADGIYFGLPTMATANAMHERIEKVYQKYYKMGESPNYILAHSASKYRMKIEENNNMGEYSEGEMNASQEAGAWLYDNRKKALLAHIGVGTIDQALLSVLSAKHQCLRLLGLNRKVLIVDEVHAYDSYMNELLCNLLKFHSALGGSAILLSATLPLWLRKKFIESFAEGVNLEFSGELKTDYPLFTELSGKKFNEISVKPSNFFKKEVKIRTVFEEQETLKLIDDAVRNNKCVCWVRNTVYDAIEGYKKIAEKFGDAPAILFHSKFILGDRLKTENNIKRLFGENSGASDRVGQIVIATQVIEQSLDIDFDYMLSDLAPIDLIIQRAGRLCRHRRSKNGNRIEGPDQRGIPEMAVYMPSLEGKITEEWFSDMFPKAAYVYPHHGKLWLTADWLMKNKKIMMPDHAREMIEYIYGADNGKRMPQVFEKITNRADGNDKAKASMAHYQKLKFDEGYMATMHNWPDDEQAVTRLGESTVTLRLAKWENGVLVPLFSEQSGNEWHLSQVSVYKYAVACEDEQYRADIDKAKSNMPDKGKYCVLIPMVESQGSWKGYAINNKREKVIICYNSKKGLSWEKGDANEFD